jgi:hypothetical protein
MNPLRIGRGCQVAGVVLIVLALILLGYTSARPHHGGRKENYIYCVINLKQIGLAFRTWALDNDGQFPFNVSTNAGGTMEFCAPGSDGFDGNAVLHFLVMSNELSTPRLLVCPGDWSRQPATSFPSLQASNVTYRLHSGTNLNVSNPTAVLALCSFDGNTLYCDGSVTGGKADWKPPGMTFLDVVRHKPLYWMFKSCPVFMVTGVVLLWAGSRVRWKGKGGPKPMGLILGEALLVIVALFLIWHMLVGTAYF